MKKKVWMTAILTLILAFSLVACGEPIDEPANMMNDNPINEPEAPLDAPEGDAPALE